MTHAQTMRDMKPFIKEITLEDQVTARELDKHSMNKGIMKMIRNLK